MRSRRATEPVRGAANGFQKVFFLFAAVAVVFATGMILYVQFAPRFNGSGDVGRSGTGLGSRYYLYENRIYLNIAFQGYYLVAGADAASFTSLSRGSVNPLGKDKNAVFCGSRIIEGLDPGSIAYVSQGYISDGRLAWFCSTERDNADFRWWHHFLRSKDDDNPEKPRRRDFLLQRLDGANASRIKTMAIGYAFDDKTIFYEGMPIPNSDAASIQAVHLETGRDKDRKSDFYLRDRHRVYYKGRVLAGAHPSLFFALMPEDNQWQNDYGFDAQAGRYYRGDAAFPDNADGFDAKALRLLLLDRGKANHELFYNGNGIWYWDYKADALKLACTNPFELMRVPEQKPVVLSAGFWVDDRNAFVTRSVDIWRTGWRNGDKSLKERVTEIQKLPGGDGKWQRVEELKYDIWKRGELWKSGDNLYFAPSLGSGHGFKDALYEVRDVNRLRDAIAQRRNQSLIGEKIIQPLSRASVICRAGSYYPSMLGF